MKSSILTPVLCSLFAIPAAASETAAEPIVVTATRTAQTADETLAAVTVITRAQIEASQPRDLPELLRQHAGIDVAPYGGSGQTASIFLRGTESNHALVLVDGVRVNAGTVGVPAWQNIDPDMIDRIEIVRGPRSSLYGSDAIGGVVQIFTRRPTDGTTLNARASDGSFVTRDSAAGIHSRQGAWRGGVEISRLTSNGFPATTTGTVDSGHSNTSINAYAGANAGIFDIEVSHWQADGKTDYYSFAPMSQDFHNRVTATTLRAPLASIWTSTLRFGEMTDEIDQNQSPDYAHTRRHTLDWQNDLQLGKSDLLTVGAYGAREHIAALSYGSDYRDLTDTTAWFLQNQWKQAGHNLLLAWRRTRHDAFGSHDTGEASYGYQLTPAWLVYGSYATGFRAPDGSDRFGSGGNPNLLPETSRNAEFGTRLRLSASQLVTLNAFYNNIDDLISYVGPWPTGSMQNIDRARIRGVELAYRFQDGPWRFDAEGVTQDPENLETNRQLARRATESATLQASYTATHYTLGANVVAQGSRWDNDFSDTRLPAYAVAGVYGNYRIAADWTLGARIENLFDEQYVLVDGYRTAGRSYFFELRYQRSLAKAGPEQ